MPKASQPPSSSLFRWPVRKEVLKDRFDGSIVIRSIVGNKVSNTRL
jgi:hypothetical protein